MSRQNQIPPNQRLKYIILDFGGVISKTLFETHRESEKALGLAPGTLTWRGPFDPENDALWQRMQAEEISERDYWLMRAQEVGGLLGEEWNSMHQLVQRARGHNPSSVLRPEALNAIGRFIDGGISLAVLSNELELFYGKAFLRELESRNYFDCIVDASYSDILKPDPRAYQSCLDRLGLNAEQCLFIDDQKRNVQGAANSGMRALHFDVCAPQKSYNEALKLAGLSAPEN